ncbi:dethiobiotin synthase [Geothrix sp. 21YS21S-2]|uniref:dethiobiotin synthase n=1 Tax=Geothrix sp. 21YS21S-2 TaxID=3068893 RepID=UPI0027B9B5BE|nr:dethiobiotin synthase [Geothrix sp. 21YS21S-2]
MGSVFVAGTDTDAGKTVVAAALVAALGAGYWKPVQSGLRGAPGGDTAVVARLTGHRPGDFPRPAYEFQAALAPDQAAAEEGLTIDPARIALPEGLLVVEGAGGLLVPLDATTLMIDLAARLGLPVVLAARTGLGTINHTLLSLEALRRRGLPVAGIVFSGPDHPLNLAAIARLGGAPILGRIPWLDPLTPAALAAAAARLDLSPIGGR